MLHQTDSTTQNVSLPSVQVFPSTASSSGWPTASIIMFGGTVAPAGWLFCDGSGVSRTTYATLFGAIAVSFGPGDGSTTFNLPDFQGRMPVGKGTHTDVSAPGKSDASLVANRRPVHRHTVTDPTHTHGTLQFFDDSSGGSSPDTSGGGFHRSSIPYASTGITVGPASSNLDAPAYLVVNFIIKT